MNRTLVLLLCVCLLLTGVWAGCASYTQRQGIVIHQPIDKVAPLFTHIDKWVSWHPDVRHQKIRSTAVLQNKEQQVKLSKFTYLIKAVNPVKIYVYKIEDGDTTEAILSASPYQDGSSTYVEYLTNQSGFAWLQHQLANRHENLLQGLQSFAEDESRRYGFSIKTVPVSDTLILTTGAVTSQDSATEMIAVLYNRLRAYCQENSLAVKSYYYTSAVTFASNKTQVSVGMPVTKQSGVAKPEFEFLKLPASGRLVVGEYEGKYKDKQQIYAAMDEYVQDKHLKKVAQPLEQYQAAKAPLSDSTVVFMRLYYPVF